ncbi:MAG: GSCFA domain-containing protein [Ginsengibacter sp.]
MEFILPFQITPAQDKISYHQKIFFIGSCFTEEIYNNLKSLKFDVLKNPNGILYDARSIAYALNSYIENKHYVAQNLFLQDELWHSWQHHSFFSGIKKDEVLATINESQSKANAFLQNASWLIITLGSSYSYQLKETHEYVANCHKAPASLFDKKLAVIEDTKSEISHAIQNIKVFNPGIKIILTISPVRHIKDGIIENNRSKARLIELAHSVSEEIENVFYFPAYELVIDVLRDYRFYKSDMMHPNEIAVNYVLEKFCDTYLDQSSKKLIKELKTLLSAMNHKPFQKETIAHGKFMQAQYEIAEKIYRDNPHIDLSKEMDYFSDYG